MLKKIWIIVIILVAILCAFYFYQPKGENKNGGANNENKEQGVSKENLTYTHPELGFYFDYPSNYKITNMTDDNGETVLVQNNGKGLQIYITDFTVKVNFDANLIKKELPNEKFENMQDVQTISGFSAVAFDSEDPSIGKINNVWFVQNKKLYQVTSEASQGELFKKVMDSFSFN